MTEDYRCMTLTEAVKAVNEAGFTLHIDHKFGYDGGVGYFNVKDEGSYEIVNNVDGLDGYVVQGMCGIVASGVMKSPEEVKQKIGHREPEREKEYVDVREYL